MQNHDTARALVATSTDGTLTTTSLVVADGTGSQHESVIRLLDDNLSDFEEFGRVRFEIGPFETAGGTQKRRVAVLTEEHATLLLTYMRNSEPVKRFKKDLVKAFFELRALAIRQQHQINASIHQARARMELCQAAQGIIHPDHLEARARIVLAEGLGEHAELDADRRPLYAHTFLDEKGLKEKKRRSVAAMFGKRVKKAYVEEHGVAPEQYPLNLSNGQIRNVNAYTEADRPLLESVWREYYAEPQLEVGA
ncbi:Rha family transcriptional regulator [Gordonia malaquae]|uniref:Rha family transcriptional regulator n=1 Tax=Gordonia malaquae TaxID=410332 RepID=UPI0030C78AF5